MIYLSCIIIIIIEKTINTTCRSLQFGTYQSKPTHESIWIATMSLMFTCQEIEVSIKREGAMYCKEIEMSFLLLSQQTIQFCSHWPIWQPMKLLPGEEKHAFDTFFNLHSYLMCLNMLKYSTTIVFFFLILYFYVITTITHFKNSC